MVLLTVLGLLVGRDDHQTSATSFGKLPSGHGAVFDLLVAAGLPVSRSYATADTLPPDSTVWWVAPRGLCASDESEEPAGAALPRLAAAGLQALVEAGGHAVVFLGVGSCPELAGHALPPRTGDADASDQGDRSSAPSRQPAEPRPVRVEGALVPAARTLEAEEPRVFESAGDWRVVANLDGRPFALERNRGDGRIAVVADDFFLRNRNLGIADAAPLVVDLVRRYGVPAFDERQHGLRLEAGAVRYLAASPARYLFAGLLALGLGVAWWGRSQVPRTPPPPDTPAPTLEGFVGSLSRLYHGTRDRRRVAERYQEVAKAQLRRHLGLPPRTPWEGIEARIERIHPGGEREALRRAPDVRGEGALRAWIRELDRIVEETCR